jgi:hypothetical protein
LPDTPAAPARSAGLASAVSIDCSGIGDINITIIIVIQHHIIIIIIIIITSSSSSLPPSSSSSSSSSCPPHRHFILVAAAAGGNGISSGGSSMVVAAAGRLQLAPTARRAISIARTLRRFISGMARVRYSLQTLRRQLSSGVDRSHQDEVPASSRARTQPWSAPQPNNPDDHAGDAAADKGRCPPPNISGGHLGVSYDCGISGRQPADAMQSIAGAAC